MYISYNRFATGRQFFAYVAHIRDLIIIKIAKCSLRFVCLVVLLASFAERYLIRNEKNVSIFILLMFKNLISNAVIFKDSWKVNVL